MAAHPHASAQLHQQATAASDLAQAAQGQASRARAGLEAARQEGQAAERTYQAQAETIASQIGSASAEIQIVERMPGGAPIPIAVTPADVNVAKRMLHGAGNLANAVKAAGDPALLRRLAGGKLSPAAAAVFLRALHLDEEEAENPKLGSIWDAVGGYLHAASFGIFNFGNPNTARYRAGEVDAAIPLDPDALAVDTEDGGRLVVDGIEDAADKGSLTLEDGASLSSSEQRIADILVDEGNNVVARTPTGIGRTSDFLVNGEPCDVYTPTTGNVNRIVGAIASKSSQVRGGGVIIDLSQSPLTPQELANVEARVRGITGGVGDIRIIP